MSEFHSAGPWKQHGRFKGVVVSKQDGEMVGIADCRTVDMPAELAAANAKFIVRACNSFDDLLAACEAIDDGANWDEKGMLKKPFWDQIQQAIAKAKGV
jgi:hypothetical protein